MASSTARPRTGSVRRVWSSTSLTSSGTASGRWGSSVRRSPPGSDARPRSRRAAVSAGASSLMAPSGAR
eukprot:14587608-Alexandrium_andersonii.AAC.1